MPNNTPKQERDFVEWEMTVFGAGYGTGELPILTAVKTFFDSLEGGRSYDYEVLEKKLGDTVTWLLINIFDKAHMIEWGTSARYGWLTSCGDFVKQFIDGKTPDELYDICMNGDKDICQCGGEIKESGHEDCGKNPMLNEKFANDLRYKITSKI